jgi:hypothetical protein
MDACEVSVMGATANACVNSAPLVARPSMVGVRADPVCAQRVDRKDDEVLGGRGRWTAFLTGRRGGGEEDSEKELLKSCPISMVATADRCDILGSWKLGVGS